MMRMRDYTFYDIDKLYDKGEHKFWSSKELYLRDVYIAIKSRIYKVSYLKTTKWITEDYGR